MEYAFVINSNIELIDALINLLEDAGYSVKGFQIKDLKNNDKLFKANLDKYNPRVIIYDVSIPYAENWSFFISIEENVDKEVMVIVTTTNKKALEKIVGPTHTIELVEKPFSIEELLNKISNQPQNLI